MTVPVVLIADDEDSLRHALAELFAAHRIKVAEAVDGIEALEQLQRLTSIQFLLSDIRMPRMDGFELVQEALKLNPELKVLMMTAYADEQPGHAALKAREIRTLVKPFDPLRLVSTVLEMLAHP